MICLHWNVGFPAQTMHCIAMIFSIPAIMLHSSEMAPPFFCFFNLQFENDCSGAEWKSKRFWKSPSNQFKPKISCYLMPHDKKYLFLPKISTYFYKKKLQPKYLMRLFSAATAVHILSLKYNRTPGTDLSEKSLFGGTLYNQWLLIIASHQRHHHNQYTRCASCIYK